MWNRFLATKPAARHVAVILLLGGTVSAACSSFSSAQTDTPMAIRVEAPEVVVPVVVLDRTHRQVTAPNSYAEVDREITDLAVRDFHVFEDGVEQAVEHVAMELPRVRDVRDNISHHMEYSFTPAGIWSSADLWPRPEAGPTLSPIATYLVSYVPPNSSRGSCHRIQIKVNRRHATVYARDEYCNLRRPLSDPIGGTNLGIQMEEYGDAGGEGEFPVAVQAGSFFGDSEERRVAIAVEYPCNALKRKWAGVNLYAMVAVLGVVRDKNGIVVARFSDMDSTAPWNFYRGPLPPDRTLLKSWEAAGIPSRYETQLELPPGEYELRLVVTDGEKFGRSKVPITIGESPQAGFAVSDVILCKRFHETLEGAQAAAGAPHHIPLVSNGVEFTAAGSMRFRRSDRLISYFEVYDPLAWQGGGVSVQMRVLDAPTGELKTETGWHPLEKGAQQKSGAISIAAELAATSLAPGAYVLEVSAADAQGEIKARRAKPFWIE